jgi:mannosyltransferase
MGIEGRSSALSTAAAVWITVLFLRALDDSGAPALGGESPRSVGAPTVGTHTVATRNRVWATHTSRIGWWAAYAAVSALCITLSIYLALLVVAHGITVLLRSKVSRQLAAWATAGAIGLIFAAPIVLAAKSQSSQVGWIRQTGFKSVKSVLVDQWFGTYGAKSAPLALLAWFSIAFGLYVAFRRRSTGSWSVLQDVTVPWLVFPTAALFLYSMIGTPLYAAKYLAFCSPAVALLLAAGIRSLRARRVRQVAVCAVIVLALPSYAYSRKPNAKDGSDWKAAAAQIAAHDQRGDAVLFGNLYNNGGISRGSARSIEYSYPAAFSKVRDLEAEGQAPPADAEFGSSAPFLQMADKLVGVSRVWVVYDHSKGFADAANPDHGVLSQSGFTVSRTWRGSKTDVFLMTK